MSSPNDGNGISREKFSGKTGKGYGSGEMDAAYLQEHTPTCICYREKCKIMCLKCSFTFRGRKRKQCLVHPQDNFLMDSAYCGKCAAPSEYLVELI